MLDIVTPESVGLDSGQLARVGEHLAKRYVEPGKIPGSIALVARRGQVCYLDVQGQRDVARGTPMTADSILRIYSMTKPVTSVAFMTLFERGLFSLDDTKAQELLSLGRLELPPPETSCWQPGGVEIDL